MVVFARTLVALCFTYLIAVFSASGSATNIYITQSGSASGSCTSNVQTPSFFNSSANWGNGSNQIGPGTTVLLCGTFNGSAGSTEFTFQGSGVSGNPITLQFDSGAQLSAPYWSASGAISCTNQQYIVLNGGTNGLIQNTDNGTSLGNHQTSAGFYALSCKNSEVKNLTIKNIYINQGASSDATDTAGQNTADIVFNGVSTNSIVDSNTLSDAKIGVQFSADPNSDASNIQVYNNTISDMDWGINVGGGDGGDTMSNIQIHNNTITNWTNWQFPTNALHQDGMILFNYASGSQTLTAQIYDNYIYGDLGVGSPTGFIYCAQNASCEMFNNLLVNTGHTIDGIIWADTHLGGDQIYNNTFVGLPSDIAITFGTSTGTNVNSKDVVQNNIFYGMNIGLHDYMSLTSDLSTSNNNVWYGSGGGPPQMATNDSNFMSYSSWQASGFDTASSTSNPDLTSNFMLGAGSSAVGLGANLTSLGLSALDSDKALSPRPSNSSTHWDAGAYNSSSAAAPAPPSGLAAGVK